MKKLKELMEAIETGDEDLDRAMRAFVGIKLGAMSDHLGIVETTEVGTGKRVFALTISFDGACLPVARFLMGPVDKELAKPDGARLGTPGDKSDSTTPAINGPGGDA